MLPAIWKSQGQHDLVRLGSDHDGGYVVPRSMVRPNCVLVSMGLNDDWSFEAQYLEAGGTEVVCYDHTVNARFWTLYFVKSVLRARLRSALKPVQYWRFFRGRGISHVQRMIGYESAGGVSLRAIADDLGNETWLALKIDIEGAEYRILDQVVGVQSRLSGAVIEFHDVDLHRHRINAFLEALTDLEPAWTHGNNYGGMDPFGDPLVVEMALARIEDRVEDARATPETTPNDQALPEIRLRFEESS